MNANEIDEIRRQMGQIRHDLHLDVSNVVSGVSNVVSDVSDVMDWRSILRSHPYLLVGAAMVAGYLIVPRRKTRLEETPIRLAGVANAQGIVSPPRKKSFRPLAWAFDLAWPIATQALQAYAMVWVENQLKQNLKSVPEPELKTPRPESYQFKAPSHFH